MAKRFAVVRHFELTCEQPAARKEKGKKKETRRNGQGFRFPNAGDLCRVQINYSGRQHNHTERPDNIFHRIRESVN